jgi:hypothetical protein
LSRRNPAPASTPAAPAQALCTRTSRDQPHLRVASRETEHTIHLGTPGGEHVQIHRRVRSAEHPMLEPRRLANAQHVTGGFQFRQVCILGPRVSHHQNDVDHRLGCQTRNGSGTHVLDPHGPVTECGSHFRSLPPKPHGPLRIVFG